MVRFFGFMCVYRNFSEKVSDELVKIFYNVNINNIVV